MISCHLEAEMCDHYGVSRITVKKAMDLLVNEGLVVKRREQETFVKNITLKTDSEYPYSTSNQFSGFAHGRTHTRNIYGTRFSGSTCK